MADDNDAREPIVGEGRYAVVDAADDGAYRLVATDDDEPDAAADREGGVPIDDATIEDLAAAVDRFRGLLTDADDASDVVELTCHDCGKTWTYTGGDEHAACPNCETEVPVEGIGP